LKIKLRNDQATQIQGYSIAQSNLFWYYCNFLLIHTLCTF